MLNCPSCDNPDFQEIYHGPIRSGSFGKLTTTHHSVVECKNCKLARLKEFLVGSVEYESSEYRESYNNSSDDSKLLQMHDHEQPRRMDLLGLEKFRNKVVLDYGAGHGAFLDSIKGIAQGTVAVEPFNKMHDSLKKRGHTVFSYASEALAQYAGAIDIVVSFGVIEHVPDPDLYLKEAYSLLATGGVILLQTDNRDDILLHTKAKHFESFFYRTAHNWYFSPKNLERLFLKNKFNKTNISTNHNYDFSNFLLWHQEGKPTGNGKLTLFNKTFDSIWKSYLEENFLGELITVIGSKS